MQNVTHHNCCVLNRVAKYRVVSLDFTELVLVAKGDHHGVAQAFCDPYQILTPKRDRLKTQMYDR